MVERYKSSRRDDLFRESTAECRPSSFGRPASANNALLGGRNCGDDRNEWKRPRDSARRARGIRRLIIVIYTTDNSAV